MKRIKTTALLLGLFLTGSLAIQSQTTMTKAFTEKEKCLILIAATEARGGKARLATFINQALDAQSLTVNEMKEALSQLYAYTGFPRSLNGLGVLQSVLAEREKLGKKSEIGCEATPLPANYDALREGTAVQTELTGQPYCYDFVPATDYYLKAHLFGDIFARDLLSHAERELVTVGALSALQGVEPQLSAHVRGAHNMGVRDDQLREIPALLADSIGEVEGYNARKAVAGYFGKAFTEGKPVANPIFPKGEPNTAYAKYFIGNSYLEPLLSEGLSMANVTFEPRCRNNWHIHHKGGQILICVGGEGWYQAWGEAPRRLKAGDVVNIPAEVKHWHGATADSWFQHIAIAVPAEGATNEWLEAVSDEKYNLLEP